MPRKDLQYKSATQGTPNSITPAGPIKMLMPVTAGIKKPGLLVPGFKYSDCKCYLLRCMLRSLYKVRK